MDFTKLASPEVTITTSTVLNNNGIETIMVENSAAALAKIKELIPPGASVMNGSSRTLEEIGFIEYLKSGQHGWNNLHEAIVAEPDQVKQTELRHQAEFSDYYLGSVHALAQTGEFIIGSNTGSQLPHIVYTSPNLIFVISTKKIVPTFADAMTRLKEHVIPLEDVNIMNKYGIHTMLSKIVVFCKENPKLGRKVRIIFVNEDLGF
ncbi:MAG: lactate utilization protein [Patescibacteria group bacterium]|nr:lactate utilization protein [Patescibacteria group bacterium]